MRQIGIVREVCGEYAKVEVSRSSACEGCHANADGSCSACVSFGEKTTSAKAENTVDAKVGDRVVLETASNTIILYAAAVFLFPLLLGVVGYLVGGILPYTATPYIGAVVGFMLAFVIVWATLNKRAARRFDVRITRIL